jgi:hypothetical protein
VPPKPNTWLRPWIVMRMTCCTVCEVIRSVSMRLKTAPLNIISRSFTAHRSACLLGMVKPGFNPRDLPTGQLICRSYTTLTCWICSEIRACSVLLKGAFSKSSSGCPVKAFPLVKFFPEMRSAIVFWDLLGP